MLGDFLNFNKMITPVIIKVIFWIGVAVCAFAGLMSIIAGLSRFGSGVEVLFGLFIIVVGPLFVRIYCELLIIMFKMYESLQDIRSSLRANQTQDLE